MNTIAFSPQSPVPELVDWVDLKWLLASQGHRVDLSRLISDADYSHHCLALAASSRLTVLRQLAARLCERRGESASQKAQSQALAQVRQPANTSSAGS